MIHFGPWSLTLSFGALTGVAVAGVLVRTVPNRAANRLLAALLLVVVLRLVPYILGYAGFYDVYPWLSFAPFDLPLAIGPLLWLYVLQLVRGSLPQHWWGHLLPAALHFAVYGTIFAVCSVPQKTAIAQAVIDPIVAPAITGGSLLMLAGYGWRAFVALREYQRWLDAHLSNREEFRLHWLHTLLLLFAGTGVVWLAFAQSMRW